MKPLLKALGIIAALVIVVVIAGFIVLSFYDFNNLKPAISKAAMDSTGRELTIDGDIDLKIGLTPSLVLSGVSFQNAPWGTRPEMVKLDRFEIQVALLPLFRRNLEVKRFVLIEPDILIETNADGRLNIVFDVPEGSPKVIKPETGPSEDMPAIPDITFEKLEIVKGKLTYRDGRTDSTNRIDLNRLLVSAEGIDSPMDISLNGAFNDAVFNLKGTTGPVVTLIDPDRNFPVNVTIDAFGAAASLDGSIRDVLAQHGVDLGFHVHVKNWDEISRLAGGPVTVKDPLHISGHISDITEKAYRIKDLKINLGDNEISGHTEINVAGKVPHLDVSLSSKNLDLRTLLTSEDEAESSAQEKLFPDDPLPVDALKQVDGIFKIRFDRVLLPQIAVNNLEVDVTMKGGQIDIRPLKASAGGGTISGNIRVRPAGKALNMSTVLTVENVELGELLKGADITDMFHGALDADINVSGEGASVAAIMASLNGHTRIIAGSGRINNKYLDKIGEGIGDTIFMLLNPSEEKKQYTVVNCMISRLDISKGRADVTILAIDTDLMSVTGIGTIDLRSEQLNISLKPDPKKGIGGIKFSLGELAQPFRLGGTLASPSLAIDKTEAGRTIGKVLSGGLSSLFRRGDDVKEADLCATALEIAMSGIKPVVEVKETEEQKTPQQTIEDVIKDPGKALKDLFGR